MSVRKCSCIVVGNIDTSDVHYSINGQPVNTVSEVRDSGVVVDFSQLQLAYCFTVCFCVFCAFILFLCTDSLSSCLIFVSSVWASLPEIKRWNGMEYQLYCCKSKYSCIPNSQMFRVMQPWNSAARIQRPLLEYATCVRSPHYNYAIDKIEAVQSKFTKRLKGCKDMEYPARLSYLHLQSLERRRLTADLILTYRIIFGLVDVCMSDYFQLMSPDGDRTVTRGNPFKLSVNYCRTNTRKIIYRTHCKFETVYYQVLWTFLHWQHLESP